MPNCNNCQHLERIGGRIVEARCLALGITFPAKGVSCAALARHGERREEISPDTFSCGCALPKESPAPLPCSGVRVVNGEVV